MAKAKASQRGTMGADIGSEVPKFPLEHLHLDKDNPRLGEHAGKAKTEAELLDLIVEVFGVDDVLSSMAVNGYFDEEPLIGVRENDSSIRIVEGNRRLAAALILSADKRAKNQGKRTRDYLTLQKKHTQPPITRVPVLVYDEDSYGTDLLPYLGVRHIAPSQPWDSYAKAAWIARVLKEGKMSLEDVSQMIGDKHRTVARLFEGYCFVNQLQATGRFTPRDSYRRGRGSNPEYPFSWVYTALGFKPIRDWLQLDDLGEGPKPQPIKVRSLDKARELMTFLFGNKSQEREPAITESRQISELAVSVGEPQRRQMLSHGKSVDEVAELSAPTEERLSTYLYDAQEALQKVIVILSQEEITDTQAKGLDELARNARRLAAEIYKKIRTSIGEDSDA